MFINLNPLKGISLGDDMATPAEVLKSKRWVDIVNRHKYFLGTVLGYDPGMKLATKDFFANHYERVNGELLKLDGQEQRREIIRKALELFKNGKGKELIDKGYLHDDITNYAARELIESGWTERFREQKENLERNQLCLIENLAVKRQGSTTLLDILGSDFGDPDGNCYCDIYMEDRTGPYTLLGKRCIRLGEKNPRIRYGDRVGLIIHGRDAQGIETRLKAVLAPRPVREMTTEEFREAMKWPYAFAN